MKKVFVYDFDKTLSLKDTLFDFYWFVSMTRSPVFFLKVFIYFLLMLLHHFRVLSNDTFKRWGVSLFLVGLKRDYIDSKSKAYSKKIKLNNRLYFQAQNISSCENSIVVSASFQDYIKPLFDDSVIILASELSYKNGYVCGLLKNMYGEKKAIALKSMGFLSLTSVYTDSASDLPIVAMAENIYLVDNSFNIIYCKDLIEFKAMLKAP